MTDVLSLKKANCKNCHKCIRVCPVKSIRFSDNQAKIINSECILCGRCVVTCPQNAKKVRNDLTEVIGMIGSGRKVVASVAPSFISEFPVSGIGQFEQVLKKLGFFAARETAEGAYIVKREYERMIREHRQDVIISSCCPTVVTLIQKYHPAALPFVAPVISPMLASARQIKTEFPDAYVVFIGPCISKKEEMHKLPGYIDCVLTFDELEQWFSRREITIEPMDEQEDGGNLSRFFPKTGGIIECMDLDFESGYEYLPVDGVENCISAIQEIENGKLNGYFIEMSACEGSCINGPFTRAYKDSILRSRRRVNRYAQPDRTRRPDFGSEPQFGLVRPLPVELVRENRPSEAQLTQILAEMGKTRPEHELNCGSCGYPTCRDKATAVFNGKADIGMCLPFMREKAESFSNNVFSITPNAIVVLDEDLCIQKMNMPASHLFGVSSQKLLGSMIIELMDPNDFQDVLETGNDIIDKHIYLPECDKYVELSIVRDEKHHLLFGMFKDITAEHKRFEKYRERRDQTIEITDQVIEKQMRIVQEIASLLGETTAETKIALTRIKNTVLSEEE